MDAKFIRCSAILVLILKFLKMSRKKKKKNFKLLFNKVLRIWIRISFMERIRVTNIKENSYKNKPKSLKKDINTSFTHTNMESAHK